MVKKSALTFGLLTAILFSSLCQSSSYIERSSPEAASAQLFFFDRSSDSVTDRNWKIVSLPINSNSSGDKVMIELFGGGYQSYSTFQQLLHFGNRSGFQGYLRTTYGQPHESVRIRAYQQADGSIDIFLSIMANSWKGASVKVYEGSAITSTRPTIYETPINVGANPPGTKVFDSYEEISGLLLANSGNVGIGTSSPDEKLTVKGTIHSEEVKVDLSVPGPDYVFESDYDLRTLEETEEYIQANKHLPEIPSAKEMEANGVQLGEMNMLLLKKIEELTLHTIQQQKMIEEQGKMLEQLMKIEKK